MYPTEQTTHQQQSKFAIKNIFVSDFQQYEEVHRINIYVMRLFFALMFVFVATDSWKVILTHQGAWDPTRAVAWCTWAAYPTLALLAVFHTLRMLTIMIFMIFYKGLWLIVGAHSLWSAGTLKGSPAEEMAYMFLGIIVPILFIPWKYVFKKYILIEMKKK